MKGWQSSNLVGGVMTPPYSTKLHKNPPCIKNAGRIQRIHTDIQLKTLSRRIEVFNMKIIMRRDPVIFYPENHRIDNAVRRCLSN